MRVGRRPTGGQAPAEGEAPAEGRTPAEGGFRRVHRRGKGLPAPGYVESAVRASLQFVLFPFAEGVVFFSVEEDPTGRKFARFIGRVVVSVVFRVRRLGVAALRPSPCQLGSFMYRRHGIVVDVMCGRHGIGDARASAVGPDTSWGVGGPGGLPTLPILCCFDQRVNGYAVLARSGASGRR